MATDETDKPISPLDFLDFLKVLWHKNCKSLGFMSKICKPFRKSGQFWNQKIMAK